MSIKATLNKIITKIDKRVPYPMFYSFVMTENEKKLFDKTIQNSSYYLEFGMGGSTFRTLQKSKAIVYSIDSSLEWISLMREYFFINKLENKRLKLFHVDIGPTEEWGYPAGNNFNNLFPNYSAEIFNLIPKKIIDTILIDGRFRVACTLKSILECHENNNIKILIHDFWNRPHYHIVLKFLEEINSVDKLGVFKIKENFDLEDLKTEYDNFKFDPA